MKLPEIAVVAVAKGANGSPIERHAVLRYYGDPESQARAWEQLTAFLDSAPGRTVDLDPERMTALLEE